MSDNSTIKLILNSKEFYIPSNFQSLPDVSLDIYLTMKKKHQYKVRSKVSEYIFQSFINHWVNRTPLIINEDNYSQYKMLSNEFDRIKGILNLYEKNHRIIETKSFQKQKNEFIKQKHNKLMKLDKKENEYQKIIEKLFKNSDIDYFTMASSVKNELIDACEKGKVNYVSLLTRKKIDQNGITYVINEKEKTAGVFRNISENNKIIIPKSIKYKSKEFLVTVICEKAFKDSENIQSIEFSEDSKLVRIEKNAFESSSLQSLSIPSSVVELEDGWCKDTFDLTQIKISDKNTSFCYYDDNLILGKSDEKIEIFDVLLFARRDVQVVNIPSFIKKIAPRAFENCQNITSINFLENSQLQSIGKYAFCSTLSDRIMIPRNLKQIDEYAFFGCDFNYVEFEENSELKLICRNAFAYSHIRKITIPSQVTKIDKYAFLFAAMLKTVEFGENSELEFIGKCAFTQSGITKISIPPRVTRIEEKTFAVCLELEQVKLPINLTFIGEMAFSGAVIEKIEIPQYVAKIGSNSFSSNPLEKVTFAQNSELTTIGKGAFYNTAIKTFTIPSKVRKIKDNWCYHTPNLTYVSIAPNNKYFSNYDNKFIISKSNMQSDIYDTLVFARKDIETVTIPSFIKRINSYAFEGTDKLIKIEFDENSQIESINEGAFENSKLHEIVFSSHMKDIDTKWFIGACELISITISPDNKYYLNYENKFILKKSDLNNDIYDILVFARRDIEIATIPSFIKTIGHYAFENCHELKEVIFEANSNLQLIDEFAFYESTIESISIPKHVKEIGKNAFGLCTELKQVFIPNDSELMIISDSAFNKTYFETIYIPEHVVSIGKKAFANCFKFKYIDFSYNSELNSIGEKAFDFTSLKSFSFPSQVSHIEPNTFNDCNINIIELDENSKLRKIDKDIIHNYSQIMIPHKLKNSLNIVLPNI